MVVHSGDVGQTRNCYGIQLKVLTHSGSEPFDGRISMKFHSQQIKGYCQAQYVRTVPPGPTALRTVSSYCCCQNLADLL